MSLQILPIGQPVRLSDDIEGKIVGAWIQPGNRIQYSIAWWSGRDRHTEWMDISDFTPIGEYQRVKIGFNG